MPFFLSYTRVPGHTQFAGSLNDPETIHRIAADLRVDWALLSIEGNNVKLGEEVIGTLSAGDAPGNLVNDRMGFRFRQLVKQLRRFGDTPMQVLEMAQRVIIAEAKKRGVTKAQFANRVSNMWDAVTVDEAPDDPVAPPPSPPPPPSNPPPAGPPGGTT